MKDRIKNILQDLYTIDPSFRAHEAELTKLISALLASEPDTKFDHVFAERLRKELLGEVKYSNPFFSFFGGFSFRVATGIFVVLLLMIPFAYNYLKNNQTSPAQDGKLAVDDITTIQEERAFGALNGTSVPAKSGTHVTSNAAIPAAVPLGSPIAMSGTAPAAKEAQSRMAFSGVGGGSAGTADSMIAPDVYRPFKYSYTGDSFELADKKGSVLKRQATIESASGLITLLSRSTLNDLDIKKFQNLKIRNIDLFEDRDSGYTITFNFSDGMISINQNWDRWPMADKPNEALTANEIPDKEKIITVAKDFLSGYGITLSQYGDPEISENIYRILAAEKEASSTADAKMLIYPYYSTIMNVVWPLMVDGKKVYDEGGVPYGVTVTVDVRAQKAVGAYNIAVNHYDSSAYELETDTKRIIAVAEKGGLYGSADASAERTVKFGTPERVWMRHFQYTNGKTNELLVPALAFPLTDIPKDVYIYQQQYLLVPLVKDLLDEASEQPPVPVQTKSSPGGSITEPKPAVLPTPAQ